MSLQYIPQLNNDNFVFPNAYLAEYDTDLIQDINDNSVSGTVTTFSATTISSTSIAISYSLTWAKNNADVVIIQNLLRVASIHILVAGQNYYKPWRMAALITNGNTSATGLTVTNTFTITPSSVGVTSFVSGTYYFEVRMIGQKAIYPICQTLNITIP